MKIKEYEIINFSGKYKEKHNEVKNKEMSPLFTSFKAVGKVITEDSCCLHSHLDVVAHLGI